MENASSRNAALLVDLENLVGGGTGSPQRPRRPLNLVEFMAAIREAYASRINGFAIARAYANWAESYMSPLRRTLHKADIEPVQIYKFVGTDKNAADAAMLVDAVSTAYERPEIEVFILASADGAFTPAVTKLHAMGHTVFGASTSKPSEYLQEACDDFIWFDAEKGTYEHLATDPPALNRRRTDAAPGLDKPAVAELPPVDQPSMPAPTGEAAATPDPLTMPELIGAVSEVVDELVADMASSRTGLVIKVQAINNRLQQQLGKSYRWFCTQAMPDASGHLIRLSSVLWYLIRGDTQVKDDELQIPPGTAPDRWRTGERVANADQETAQRLLVDLCGASQRSEYFAPRLQELAQRFGHDGQDGSLAAALTQGLAEWGFSVTATGLQQALAGAEQNGSLAQPSAANN